jgi:hypothetical protein
MKRLAVLVFLRLYVAEQTAADHHNKSPAV